MIICIMEIITHQKSDLVLFLWVLISGEIQGNLCCIFDISILLDCSKVKGKRNPERLKKLTFPWYSSPDKE